jgi:hypothetical protein
MPITTLKLNSYPAEIISKYTSGLYNNVSIIFDCIVNNNDFDNAVCGQRKK